jgi:hypothetical protein
MEEQIRNIGDLSIEEREEVLSMSLRPSRARHVRPLLKVTRTLQRFGPIWRKQSASTPMSWLVTI